MELLTLYPQNYFTIEKKSCVNVTTRSCKATDGKPKRLSLSKRTLRIFYVSYVFYIYCRCRESEGRQGLEKVIL